MLSLKWKRGAYWNDSAYSIEAFVRMGLLIETLFHLHPDCAVSSTGAIPKLSTLQISHNRLSTVDDLRHLSGCCNLR